MLVACSGEGKGGTLSVLRRSVVPDIITEVPLPGLLGAWAVRHVPDGGDVSTGVDGSAENGTADQGRYHSYLLLSFVGATKVLATGEELREVTER
jgi:cleavage and polyadenylation specificity factor subunit 1